MKYFVVECYCTCILREFKIFFYTSKFDNFKDEKKNRLKKLSQLHKAKTCLTENFCSFFDDEWAFSVFNRSYAHSESVKRKVAAYVHESN